MKAIQYTVNTETTPNLKIITLETLRRIVPKAAADYNKDLDEDDLDIIWIMTEKPVMVSSPEEDEDREEWTETNEPELAERISEDWDKLAVTVEGQQVVIICGTLDDEYGKLWNQAGGYWEKYMY